MRGELQNRLAPRRAIEQSQSVIDRVFLRRRSQFVHETFDDEDIVRWPHTSPPGSRNAGWLDADIIDMHIRQSVLQVYCRLDSVAIQAVLEGRRKPPRKNGGASQPVRPRDGLSAGIEASRDAVIEIGPVHIVLDVFLATPNNLHRPSDLLGNLHRTGDAIDLEPPAETTADQVIVDDDLVQRR